MTLILNFIYFLNNFGLKNCQCSYFVSKSLDVLFLNFIPLDELGLIWINCLFFVTYDIVQDRLVQPETMPRVKKSTGRKSNSPYAAPDRQLHVVQFPTITIFPQLKLTQHPR